jgi:hypothetical protein
MEDKTILNFVATKEFIEKIDDYRFAHRFQTRAEAIRFLIDWALEQNPKPNEYPGQGN